MPPPRVAGKYRKRRRERSHVAAIVEQLEDRTLLAAPVAYDVALSTLHDQALSGSVSGSASDPDFDPLTFAEQSGPSNGDLTFYSNGNFEYTPNAGYVGSDSFTWTASDGGSTSNLATVSIDVYNDAPNDNDVWLSTLHDQPLSGSVSGSASDPNFDPLTFVIDTLPANGTLNDYGGTPLSIGATFDGNYQYVPDALYVGSDSFTWHASDGIADSDGATVNIDVYNNAPNDNDVWLSTLHDQPLSGSVSGSASDPNFDPLTYIIDTLPANGTLNDYGGTPLSIGATFDGNYQYVPDALFVGADSFTWHASDGIADSDGATVNIDVYNDAPTDTDVWLSTLHDQPLSGSVSGSASDPNFDPLTYIIDTLPANGTLNDYGGTPLSIGATFDGNYQYVPDALYVGSDSFTWHASDGIADSDGATVFIDVTNNAPTITGGTFGIGEDASNGAFLGTVSASDADFSDSLALSITAGNTGDVFAIDNNGYLTVNDATMLDYETQPQYTLTVEVTDGIASDSATVTVNVNDVNEPPVFDPDWYAFGIDEDEPTGTVLGSVSVTDPEGESVTLSIADGMGGSIPFAIDSTGEITLDGTLDYDVQNFYDAVVTATDASSNSSTAPVEIYVYEVTVPVAVDGSYSTLHDVALDYSVSHLASDEDGDELTFHEDTGPSDGSLTFNSDGTFTYTPDEDFTGSDSFTWHASDGENDSNVATFTIDVYNNVPTTFDSWHTTGFEETLAASVADNAHDEDADPLTYHLHTSPVHGNLDFNADGTFEFTPSDSFTGDTNFSWYASDGIDDSALAAVYIHVEPDYSTSVLVAEDDVAVTERDTPVTIDVLANDGSAAGGLEVTQVTTPTNGSVSIAPDGSTVTYTPNDPNYYGPDTFDYLVEDSASESVWATVDVYVVWLDLDVNNDGDLEDEVDGVENYLPGYVGEENVLSTGDTLQDAQYVGQDLQLIIEGIGTDADVQQIEFELFDITSYEGYTENTSDPVIEGSDKDNDFSFAQDVDQSLFVLLPGMTLAAAKGEMEVNRSRVRLTAKDMGAKSTVRITIRGPWGIPFSKEIEMPQDADKDNLSDGWEFIHRLDWNAQYGTSETGLGLFSGKIGDWMDSELPDADAGSNTDGGRNLPAHEKAGDRLMVFQEYRGFVLDGGGFAGDGTGGWSGGHKRLSPVHKELLVEVDSMAFKADGATTGIEHGSNAFVDTVLANASKGFSDNEKGAGIDMYWVRSEKDVTYKTFATKEKVLDEMLERRKNPKNPRLKINFVHLMFFGNSIKTVTNESGAWTDDDHVKEDKQGSVIFLDRLYKAFTEGDEADYPFTPTVSSVTAHELTHLLLFPTSTPSLDDGWLSGEHHLEDKKYLMYDTTTSEKSKTIWFSDKTIGKINDREKDGTNP